MKKEIKLTQKQEQVLKRYNELLAKHDYQPVWVDTAYVDMTALNKIVGANWFDRTFDALVQKGLLVKVEQEKTVEEGYFEGRDYTDWHWELTDLGFEYLGIDNPNKPVEEVALGQETVQELKIEGKSEKQIRYAGNCRASRISQFERKIERLGTRLGINDVISIYEVRKTGEKLELTKVEALQVGIYVLRNMTKAWEIINACECDIDILIYHYGQYR